MSDIRRKDLELKNKKEGLLEDLIGRVEDKLNKQHQ